MSKLREIPFTKIAGTGNDFIVFDNRSLFFSGKESHFFSKICRRSVSVGADGILLLEDGVSAPVRMRYFNSDGWESTMCGNGARCIGFFVWEKKIVNKKSFSLEALDGVHRVRVEGEDVTVSMIRPHGFRSELGIIREPEFTEGGFVNTGVPHFVIFTDDVDRVDVNRYGPFYRKHEVFPQGTNVNFVQLLERKRIRVRTYERGVEKETLSCGTGCVASALITSRKYAYDSSVAVMTRGGELTVRFDEKWDDIILAGRVEIVYEGILAVSPDRVG